MRYDAWRTVFQVCPALGRRPTAPVYSTTAAAVSAINGLAGWPVCALLAGLDLAR
jgi:hypothetical protein